MEETQTFPVGTERDGRKGWVLIRIHLVPGPYRCRHGGSSAYSVAGAILRAPNILTLLNLHNNPVTLVLLLCAI